MEGGQSIEVRAARGDRAAFTALMTATKADLYRFIRRYVGDEAEAGAEHPIRVETDPETGEPSPSVHVRADLWARIARPVFYELVEMAGVEDGRLTVRSGGTAFALGPVGAGVE